MQKHPSPSQWFCRIAEQASRGPHGVGSAIMAFFSFTGPGPPKVRPERALEEHAVQASQFADSDTKAQR